MRSSGDHGGATERNRRLTEWLDLVGDLLQRPRSEFPVAEVALALSRTFRVRRVSWSWRDETGRAGLASWPREHAPRPPTTSPPDEARPPPDVGQRLTLPVFHHGGCYRAFVLGRPRDDFDARDLDLARHLQRLIRGLYLQLSPVGAEHARAEAAGACADRLGLTATERAALVLLAQGHTTYGISRRLEMAPRTASKHLEHIYRKLGVTHRVAAVNAAHEAGLVGNGAEGAEALSRSAAPATR